MLSWLRPDPIRKLEREYAAVLERARDVLRSGDVRANAELIAEAEELARKIDALRAEERD